MRFFSITGFASAIAGFYTERISVDIIRPLSSPLRRAFFLIITGNLLLASCIPPATNQDPIQLPTAIPQPSATATVVWFPPTSTPTLLPTRAITPTPVMKTGIGEVLYSDLLAENTGWEIGSNSTGTTAHGNGELTMAVSAPSSILTSLRASPILDNFYLEVTARPNLCRDQDAYGLMVRSDTRYNTYRFAVACNGMIRVERLKDGQIVVLQDWTRSGQLPLGAPLAVRLGIWASGTELRFFINDVYQFSTTDPVWSSGQVGLFARSNGETALSVSFTELEVRQIEPLNTAITNPTLENQFPEEEMDH